MPLPQTPVRRGRRLAIAVAVSVLGHAAMLPFVAHDANFHMPKHPARQTVSLMATPHSALATRSGAFGPNTNAAQQLGQDPKLPPAKPPPEDLLPQKLQGQVVSLGPPQDERAPEKPTKYLSEKDSRVLKETRARETSAFFKNALSKVQKEGRNDKGQQGAPLVTEKPGDNGAGGGSEQKRPKQAAELPSKKRRDALRVAEDANGTLRNRDATEAMRGTGRKVAIADPGSEARPSSVGPGAPGAGAGAPGAQSPLKLSLEQPLGAAGPLAGGPMPDDLRGVEEGDETLLNSRSFKYAGFLNRVKETVGRVWVTRVQDEAGKRDPSGQLFSYKDRRTVVEFTLDSKGEVTDVHVAAGCGVPYLDNVAVEAFKIVQRFPNPPPGLIGSEGNVKLPFAFTLLAATGGMKLQVGPAYLPGSPAARGF
ncbi:MAG TPA: energy transducer TonB [Myxococcales bacterium]